MKKKTLFIIIIFLSLLLVIIGFVFYFNKENNKKNTKTEVKEERIIEFSNEQSELKNKKMLELYLKLDNWGKKIYEKKEYQTFSIKNDMYFISLNDLSKKYNYDISIFKDEKGTYCDKDASGIFFDINNIRKLDMDIPVLSILVDCGINE